MQAGPFDVYAEFLLECKEVMGSVDFDRLDQDDEYRSDVCQRIASKVDGRLFYMADLINRKLDMDEEEEVPTH